MKLIVFLLFITALIVGMPLIIIWSLNTLFSFNIPFTFATWFATLILAGVVSGNSKCSSREE